MRHEPEHLTAVIAGTPVGWMGVALSGRGIRYATLLHSTRDACLMDLTAHGVALEENDDAPTSALAAEARERMERYGAGDGSALAGFPIDLPEASEFSTTVWQSLSEIPAGETRTYGWLAAHLGCPQSARAVGRAIGANPVPLWLPCHRVVASDGSLHGFGGGLEMKRQLLELEGALQPSLF